MKRNWKKPVLWAGGIITALVTAFVMDWFKPIFTDINNDLRTSGEPVAVRVAVESDCTGDVILPPESPLSEDDLELLASLPNEKQCAWLVDNRDGIISGTRTLVLTLRGNRSHQVRITDLQPVMECGSPPRGTLMRMASHGAGLPSSTHMSIDLWADNKDPWVWDFENVRTRPFFPEKTITLLQDEEEVVIVDLHPNSETGRKLCRVELEMTVFDGDQEAKQRISDNGRAIPVMSFEDYEVEPSYSAVYVGGYLCPTPTPVAPGWQEKNPLDCVPDTGG